MQIKELKAKQGNVDLIVQIVEKQSVREFQKFGKPGRVCNAKVKDESGEVTLTLWNEDIDKVKVGDQIHITNGWVGDWQGELQLSTGRFGKLEVVGNKEVTKDETEESTITEANKSDEGEHVLTEDEATEEEILDNVEEENIG